MGSADDFKKQFSALNKGLAPVAKKGAKFLIVIWVMNAILSLAVISGMIYFFAWCMKNV